MKKTIIIASIIGGLIILLDSLDIGHWLVLFLLVGVVPGTNILISPIDMMAAVATSFTIIILRLTVWPIIRPYVVEPVTPNSPASKRTRRRTI